MRATQIPTATTAVAGTNRRSNVFMVAPHGLLFRAINIASTPESNLNRSHQFPEHAKVECSSQGRGSAAEKVMFKNARCSLHGNPDFFVEFERKMRS